MTGFRNLLTSPYVRLVLVAAAFGVAFSVLDAAMRAWGTSSHFFPRFGSELGSPQSNVFWARSLALALFIVYGIYVALSRRRHDRAITYMAYHDPLTGLANRALLTNRMEHELVQARRHNEVIAVLFIDLDNLKVVNDTLGHKAGDQLLATVAKRLRVCLRREDTVARIGGDEFVVALRNFADPLYPAPVAQKIINSLRTPFSFAGRALYTSASIGIAVFPRDGHDFATLLKHADAAMYQAKNEGKNRFRFYSARIGRIRIVSHSRLQRDASVPGRVDCAEGSKNENVAGESVSAAALPDS